MHEQLLEQIDRWHNDSAHLQIVQAIEAVPEEARDYALWGQYAVANNNIGRHQRALHALDRIRDEGLSDPAWHYRRGYALFYLDREDEAAASVQHAVDLGGCDAHILDLQQHIRDWMRQQADLGAVIRQRRQAYAERDRDLPPFHGFDLSRFWADSDWARKEYVGEPYTDAQVRELEAELGYRLPASYLWLMRRQNGGTPRRTFFPDTLSKWEDEGVRITGIMGVGRERPCSLGGAFGSRFWTLEWGYPDIGIAVCDCPSAGHDMIFLDYRACGPEGEPDVVHVDQERGYTITWLAESFERFIRGLEPDPDEDEDGEDDA